LGGSHFLEEPLVPVFGAGFKNRPHSLLMAFLVLGTEPVFRISEKIWLGGFQH
jgi:hypothetical protein